MSIQEQMVHFHWAYLKEESTDNKQIKKKKIVIFGTKFFYSEILSFDFIINQFLEQGTRKCWRELKNFNKIRLTIFNLQ